MAIIATQLTSMAEIVVHDMQTTVPADFYAVDVLSNDLICGFLTNYVPGLESRNDQN
jgi:hypothetical protein